MTLFKTPLTADQLQRLRELRAEQPQPKPAKASLPESLEAAFLRDPLFVGLLIFANCVAFLILLHFIL